MRLVAVVRRALGRVREAQRRRLRRRSSPARWSPARAPSWACRCWRPRCSGCSRRTSRSSTRTPTRARGTWARPARRRPSTTAAPSSAPPPRCASSCSTTPPSKLEASRGRPRVAAEGVIRVKGSPDQSVAIADLAGSGKPYLGKGSGDVPEALAGRHRLALHRRPRPRVLPRAAADHARGAREGRPRDRRRARAAVRRGARLGQDRQPDRRRRAGLRRRHDGPRAGAHRGHAVRRRRPPAQPAPARLQADDRLGRARDHDPLGRGRHAERRARRARRASASRPASPPRARSATPSRGSSASTSSTCR